MASDVELLRRSAGGEEAAFNALYDRHQQAVYRFALYCGGSTEIAEEITQEVFLLLIRAPRQYAAARGSLSAYLCGVARHRLHEHWKRTRAFVPLDDEEHGRPAYERSDDPLGELTSREALDALRRAVLALPMRYREVVVLCHLQGMGYREAAGILECAERTVCSRLICARALLMASIRIVTPAKPFREHTHVHCIECTRT